MNLSQTMNLEIVQIPVWADNYIYLIHNKKTGQTAVIDPAEADAVNQCLKEKSWELNFIFNTHHHPDHIGGNLDLKKKWNCKIYGYKNDASRIPGIDKKLDHNEEFYFGSILFKVIYVPGHTLGHIVYWSPTESVLFCGDTLFAMGCGYLFEGSAEQMFNSLNKISQLPKNTTLYCAHEYSLNNAKFALTIDKNNLFLQKRFEKVQDLRKKNLPTVPFTLQEEMESNPFLRAKTVAEFAKLRHLKNNF